MKTIKIILLLLSLIIGATATAATPVADQSPTVDTAEALRLVFIGALSGYVKPCG